MLSFSTVDNQHRQSFVATSLDEGFCVMGDGNEARLGAPVLASDELLGLVPRSNFECRAPALTITDTPKSSSEVYGKIEGFTSPAV